MLSSGRTKQQNGTKCNKNQQNSTKQQNFCCFTTKQQNILFLHNKTAKQQNNKTTKQQNILFLHNKTTKYFVSPLQNNTIFESNSTKQQNILLVYWLPLSTLGPTSFGPKWYLIHCLHHQCFAFLGFQYSYLTYYLVVMSPRRAGSS